MVKDDLIDAKLRGKAVRPNSRPAGEKGRQMLRRLAVSRGFFDWSCVVAPALLLQIPVISFCILSPFVST